MKEILTERSFLIFSFPLLLLSLLTFFSIYVFKFLSINLISIFFNYLIAFCISILFFKWIIYFSLNSLGYYSILTSIISFIINFLLISIFLFKFVGSFCSLLSRDWKIKKDSEKLSFVENSIFIFKILKITGSFISLITAVIAFSDNDENITYYTNRLGVASATIAIVSDGLRDFTLDPMREELNKKIDRINSSERSCNCIVK